MAPEIISSHDALADETEISIEPESTTTNASNASRDSQQQQQHQLPPKHVQFRVQPPPPSQEQRLENVRRVRDEAEGLRQEICQLRIRMEEVEEESKFHAAKANELTELLLHSNSNCHGHGHSNQANAEELSLSLQQSEVLAQRACQIETLEKKITSLTTEKALLEIERDKAKKETADLSSVVRSLQSVTTLSMDNNKAGGGDGDDDDDGDSDDESDDEEEEIILTPETALDLTLGNLKEHIEMLEDGLQTSSQLNATQKQKISALEKDNHLNEVKIGMLEELFRELNVNDREFYEARAVETDKNNEGNKNLRSSSSLALVSSKNENETVREDPTAREHNLKRLGLIERFRAIRMGAFIGPPQPQTVDPDIAIPEKAVAAAKAAAVLMGSASFHGGSSNSLHGGSLHGGMLHDGSFHGGSLQGLLSKSLHGSRHGPPRDNNNGSKDASRKTTMKKVKIRFKKAGLEGTYTGPLVDKRPHGVGTIRFTNGDTYLGEMTRGKMSGTGTLYTKSRGTFRGQFENNRFVGEKQPGSDSPRRTSANDSAIASVVNAAAAAASAASAGDSAAKTESLSPTQSSNAIAALELDGLSPTTITGTQDIMDGIDDMVVGTDSMDLEHSDHIDSMAANAKQQENDAFLKELEGVDAAAPSKDAAKDAGSDTDTASAASKDTATPDIEEKDVEATSEETKDVESKAEYSYGKDEEPMTVDTVDTADSISTSHSDNEESPTTVDII
eukprot:jgi/Psemu1/292179/fgenesh1_pg.942_\